MEKPHYKAHELAELAGVTVRTLHHYEAKGLISPEREENGYRHYTNADVERLQHILIFRSCGLSLAEIGTLLGKENADIAAELERHLASLHEQHRAIELLIETAEKTIRNLKGEITMTDEERFEGLKREAIAQNEKQYGSEARKRYGNEVIDAANERLQAMGEAEWNDMKALEAAIIDQLIVARSEGNAQSESAQKLANMHARWIKLHWPQGAYSVEAHKGLAKGYLGDERFVEYYDTRAGNGATKFLVKVLLENL